MEEILFESNKVIVVYMKSRQLIELTWKSPGNSEIYKQVFSNLVDFGSKNRVRFMLSDLRNEGVVSVDDLKWLDENALSKAIEFGVERIALLIEDSTFAFIYAETIKRKLRHSNVQVRHFTGSTEARSWLES